MVPCLGRCNLVPQPVDMPSRDGHPPLPCVCHEWPVSPNWLRCDKLVDLFHFHPLFHKDCHKPLVERMLHLR